MIPEFPEFKKLELSDKEDVEVFTKKFPPYSDFNFVSMWSWDIKGEMRLSQLNNNLVVRFTDYLTGDPFFSFLGDNEVNDTIKKLLEFSKSEGLRIKLKLIPECSIKNADITKYNIKEDEDNSDYIYNVQLISEYKGASFSDKRNNVNHFVKSFPKIYVELLNLKDPATQKNILKLDKEWLANKI